MPEFNDDGSPYELDVPHWGLPSVQRYRRDLDLPARITDRMIWARILWLDQEAPKEVRNHADSKMVAVRRLIVETLE